MSVELPEPKDWLAAQLKKRGYTSQNDFGRKHNIPSSAVSNFARGTAGAQTALQIAEALNVPIELTLTLQGKYRRPSRINEVEVETLQLRYGQLSASSRKLLLDYAFFLIRRQDWPAEFGSEELSEDGV